MNKRSGVLVVPTTTLGGAGRMRRGITTVVSAMVAAALMCALVPTASFASEQQSATAPLSVPVQRAAAARQVQVTLPAAQLDFTSGGLVVNDTDSWGDLSMPVTFVNGSTTDLYLSGATLNQNSAECLRNLYAQGAGTFKLSGSGSGLATAEVDVTPVETAEKAFVMPANAKDVFTIGKEGSATFQLTLDTAELSPRPQGELEALCSDGAATVALGSVMWTVAVVSVTTNITLDWNGGMRILYGDIRDQPSFDPAISCTGTYGQNLPEVRNPQRDEWVFNGYYDEQTGKFYYKSGGWGSGITPWDRTEPTYTLKAAWRRPVISLVTRNQAYDQNGKPLSIDIPQGYITTELYGNFEHFEAPAIAGYRFLGLWKSDSTQIYDQNGNSMMGPTLTRDVWKSISSDFVEDSLNAGEVINRDCGLGTIQARYQKI